MVLGLFPAMTISVSAQTQQEAVSWLNSWHAKTTTMGGLAQCVAFYNEYLQSFWGIDWSSVGHISQASDIETYNRFPSTWTRKTTPQPGDVAVYSGSPGHVGIVVEVVSPTEYYTMDQNSGLICEICHKIHQASVQKIKRTSSAKIYIRPNFETTPLQRPTAPAAASLSPTNIGIGTTITGSWSAVSGADKYRVELFYNNSQAESYELSATSRTFIAQNAGQYFIRVYAYNSAGWSISYKDSVAITVQPNKTVTFVDWDGKEIGKPQSVKYGGAATAPSAPSREGYTWQGWDKVFNNVTSDIIVMAIYSKNRYNVRFIGENGSILKTEQVYYLDAATPPGVTPPAGYKFVGWSSQDYLSVKSALDITAVFEWENPDLPNIITINSAVRNSSQTGYDVNISMQNFPSGATQGRIIATLKTSQDKMVAVTTETYRLDQLANTTRSVYIPYSGVATIAEISIVGVMDDANTGVPLAQLARKTIDLGLEWSDWSETEPPQGSGLITESRTEYRFRDRQTTTSSSPIMNGWTQYDYNVTGWNAWSAWQNSSIAETYNGKGQKTREVGTQSVAAQYKTVYQYYHYCKAGGYCANYSIAGYSFHTIETDTMPTTGNVSGFTATGNIPYWIFSSCGNTNKWFPGTSYTGQPYGVFSKQIQTAAAYTQWRYRDAITTYNFYKWTDWTDWTEGAAPTATGDKEVETRLVHRFKSNDLGALEDTSGLQRSISGSINAPDKLATLLVFRQTNQDPTASQLQYVDQILLGTNGEYDFDFHTKDEPSGSTGDFIIMLAVEGGTSPVYIGRIEAPKPLYTVVFVDEDGTELSRQSVIENNFAVLPPNPVKEGYNFTGWNDTTTNIRQDMTIAATYELQRLTVVFTDWDYGDVEIKEVEYGNTLYLEDLPEKTGNSFVEWVNANDETVSIVLQNMIVTAKYTLNTYTITFIDWEGNTISEQEIEYGGEAVVPDAPVFADMVFAGWSDYYSIYFVHQDAVIQPIYAFTETVETPKASVAPGSNSTAVSLSCETAGAQIYYYLFDETELEEPDWYTEFEWIEYTVPIVISDSDTMMFYAALEGMNDSIIMVINAATLSSGDIIGDVNDDGKVDATDLSMLIADFGKTSGFNPRSDVNEDNKVDATDLSMLIANFGK